MPANHQTPGIDPPAPVAPRIAFFGGSFDPPHLGHLAVATAAQSAFGLDTVLLAPTGRQPLKKGGAEASFPDRLAMAELLCSLDAAHLRASDLDAPRPDGQPNYTVDTLQRLHDRDPGARLFAIVGADSFLDLPRWRSPERLFALAEWIVVSRPGHPLPTLARDLPAGARIHQINDVAFPIASRDLRERVRAGESCSDALPAPVLTYISQHGLYLRPQTA